MHFVCTTTKSVIPVAAANHNTHATTVPNTSIRTTNHPNMDIRRSSTSSTRRRLPSQQQLRLFHHRLAFLFALGGALTTIMIGGASTVMLMLHLSSSLKQSPSADFLVGGGGAESLKQLIQHQQQKQQQQKLLGTANVENHLQHFGENLRLQPGTRTAATATRMTETVSSTILLPVERTTTRIHTSRTEQSRIPTAAKIELPPSNNRFPAFGTLAFNQTCSWAMQSKVTTAGGSNGTQTVTNNNTYKNCTLWAEPPPNYREGISAWFARITSGFVMAKQTGCSMRITYAQGVNLSDIILPTSASWDWTVPHHSKTNNVTTTCQERDHCHLVEYAYPRGGGPVFRDVRPLLAFVPPFRTPYLPEVKSHEAGLKRTLGSAYALETTMACATGVLFQLSPSIIRYQPNLFSTILPTLRDPTNYVISLYIRTGHTEALQVAERTDDYRAMAERIVQCALLLERRQQVAASISTASAQRGGHGHPQNVVWMLVTDSQFVKTWVTESYSNNTVVDTTTKHYVNNNNNNNNNNTTTVVSSSRTILVTQSRGAHTKGSPSTADVAEGFLDWYLIGESDVVVSDHHGPSFGNTASFRTARPHYKVPKIEKQVAAAAAAVASEDDICRKLEPAMEYTNKYRK